MLPLILDGTIQLFTNYESTNVKRLITGFLFGIGFCSIIAQTITMAFNYGFTIGQILK